MVIRTQHNFPLIIGHRGASREAPENTLESFRLAWAQGADGIEADFRLTADGTIVCMHDATSRRTTGTGLEIGTSTAAELQLLDAGSWKGDDWGRAAIPTLDEVLAVIPGGTWFFVELKSGEEIITPLEKALRTSGVSPERIRLLSFDAPLIAALARQMPDWHTCWLCDCRHSLLNRTWSPSRTDVIDTLLRSGAAGLASADKPFLDRQLITQLKSLGKEIHVWTVDRKPAAENLCRLGVDSIMTNRPGWLRQRLAGSSDEP